MTSVWWYCGILLKMPLEASSFFLSDIKCLL
jgi:hypothetical protein